MHDNNLDSFRLCSTQSYWKGLSPFTRDDMSEVLLIQPRVSVWNCQYKPETINRITSMQNLFIAASLIMNTSFLV